jgi:hypothetical protein
MQQLIAYAIAAVLILAGIFFAVQSGEDAKGGAAIQVTFSELQTLRGNMQKFYSNQNGRYGNSTVTATTLVQAGIAPQKTITSTSPATLTNEWGGALLVTGNTNSFFTDLDNLDQPGCTGFLGQTARGTGIIGVSVGSTIAGAAGAASQTLPVPPDTAVALCATALNAVRVEMN